MKKFKNVIVALLVLIMGTLSGCAAFQNLTHLDTQRPVWTQRTKVSLMNI